MSLKAPAVSGVRLTEEGKNWEGKMRKSKQPISPQSAQFSKLFVSTYKEYYSKAWLFLKVAHRGLHVHLPPCALEKIPLFPGIWRHIIQIDSQED